jgi:REP element-mobilizing transposase RayT
LNIPRACPIARRARPDFHPAAWLASQIVQIFPSEQFAVVAYCVMPDHVHLLLEGCSEAADLRSAMHVWKQRTAFEWKRRCGRRLWQSGFYDYVLRDDDPVPAIVKYIIGNPVRAGIAAEPSQYPHSGSSRYRFEELANSVRDWRPRRA